MNILRVEKMPEEQKEEKKREYKVGDEPEGYWKATKGNLSVVITEIKK